LEWFNSYSYEINQWTSEYGDKEPEVVDPTPSPPVTDTPTGKTNTPVTGKTPTSTPAPSSATLNAYNSLVILQLTVFTVLIKTYFL